uniref:Uncharacterized protein n=1 Tax=Anguilla anguilla TaxID=7936 RepID=A0A0E9VTK9_ANGAN
MIFPLLELGGKQRWRSCQ